MLKEIIEGINEAGVQPVIIRKVIQKLSEGVSEDDVQYYLQLADQAKKDKKTEKEAIKILKDAGAPQDIIADVTQRWGKRK